jgi:hypothetical protein
LAETDYTLALRVQAHLRAAGLPAPDVPDIVPVLASAREAAAHKIAGDLDRRRELRPDVPFPLQIAAGAGSLSTLLDAPNRLLLKWLPDADVRDSQRRRLYFVGRDRYELRLPAGYGYFTFEGETLLARLKGDEAGSSTDTLALSANFSPTSEELPDSCVPDVVLAAAALLAPAPPQKGGRR